MSEPVAITIGNFDGVHRGHQALLARARAKAGPAGRVVAIAFESHPLSVLRPSEAPAALSTPTQRRRFLFEAGADDVEWLAATPETLLLEHHAFITRIADRLKPRWIVEGEDFRFGRDRRGDLETLRATGRDLGFDVAEVPPVRATLSDHADVRVSSTMIRWLVSRGRMRDAAALLGRAYELEAKVTPGARRGRDIGFPTANLTDTGCLLPADGVYAGLAMLPDGQARLAAISVGTNPTFVDRRRTCEAYLLDHAAPTDDYGWVIRLTFHAWVREQIRFPSIDALVRQIGRDVDRVRAFMAGKARAIA